MSARTLPQPTAPYGIPIVGEFYIEFIADPAMFEPDRFSWKAMPKGGLIMGRLPNGQERILAFLIEQEKQEMTGLPQHAVPTLEASMKRRQMGFLFI